MCDLIDIYIYRSFERLISREAFAMFLRLYFVKKNDVLREELASECRLSLDITFALHYIIQ